MPKLALLASDRHLVCSPAFRGIIIRGIEHRNIFLDNKDRENLSRRLGELLPATKASCYVYPV